MFVSHTSIGQMNPENTLEDLVINSLLTQENKPVNQPESKVFINQIGTNNVANTIYRTENNTQFISQLGADNFTLLELNSVQIKADVLQKGTGNTYSDYDLIEKQTLNIKLRQQGDNLSFERFDTNSKSKDMQVTMQGYGKSVIVRNFDR